VLVEARRREGADVVVGDDVFRSFDRARRISPAVLAAGLARAAANARVVAPSTTEPQRNYAPFWLATSRTRCRYRRVSR
jgi:hypothetical protein